MCLLQNFPFLVSHVGFLFVSFHLQFTLYLFVKSLFLYVMFCYQYNTFLLLAPILSSCPLLAINLDSSSACLRHCFSTITDSCSNLLIVFKFMILFSYLMRYIFIKSKKVTLLWPNCHSMKLTWS